MSVKRYDFDCYAFYDSARLNVNECADGDYVLHTDYVALLARHKALRDAVKKEHVELDALDDARFQLGSVGMPIWTYYAAARAEVDRLLNEGGE